MSRKKTGGKQAGYSKHGEETINLAGRIPKSLFEKFELFPGTKTDKIIHAIKLYIMNTDNLIALLSEKSGCTWFKKSETEVYCDELWGESENDANVSILGANSFEIRLPSTTEIFDLEGLVEFVVN